jgi:hypothetical protein
MVFFLALMAGPRPAVGDRKGAEFMEFFSGQAHWPDWGADITFDHFSACCAEETEPVRVRWETRWEVNILGFHIWRSDFEGGVYTRRSRYLIDAVGTPHWGAGYLFEDRDAWDCYPYYYRLEVLSFDDGSRFTEPVRTCRDQRRDEDDGYVHATCFVSALVR